MRSQTRAPVWLRPAQRAFPTRARTQSVVVLIEAAQQVGSSAPDWLASGEICRAAEPRARAALVALRGRAAPGTKKKIGGGDFVAGALRRCSFDGQRTRQPAIVEGYLAQLRGSGGLLSGSRRIAA